MTYALSFPLQHRTQTTCLHPALSWAATSIFLQLYMMMKPAVHISFSRSFFGCSLTRWPCIVYCSVIISFLSVSKTVPQLIQNRPLISFSP